MNQPAPNSILLACEIAWRAYEQGKITKQALMETLQLAINATAVANGYADDNGLPFPEEP